MWFIPIYWTLSAFSKVTFKPHCTRVSTYYVVFIALFLVFILADMGAWIAVNSVKFEMDNKIKVR